MSDLEIQERDLLPLNSPEWWYLAAAFEEHFAAKMHTADKQVSLSVPNRGLVTFRGDGEKTFVTIYAPANLIEGFANEISQFLVRMSIKAQLYRRYLVGAQFTDIIKEYYAAKERGEKPNLRAMADAAGLKYDSLRQAKVKYDRDLRLKVVS
jgi:hypothetical protein